jgi:hypothetical protein
MQKRVRRGFLLALAAVFALSVFAPVSALAHEGHSHDDKTTSTEDSETHGSELKSYIQKHRAMRKEAGSTRLEDAKQRVCNTRKANITAIMNRGATRAENHIKVFDAIAQRTKTFYEKKGKVLANYDELVTAVDAARAKAVADIATLKTLDELDCSGEDPKGNVEDYKTALKTVKEDLKAYRTAVKNLIVGVKSVQSTGDSEEGQQ